MNFRRILVALDDSPHSLAALEAAAGLAAMMRGELAGVFVEDVNLIRLAALPGSREIVFPMAIRRDLDPLFLEHCLKDQAEKARQALAEAASRAGVAWTFGVRQGRVDRELLLLAEDADLLVLGKAGSPRSSHVPLGSNALGLLRQGNANCLIMQQGEPRHGPALLIVNPRAEPRALLSGALSLLISLGAAPVVVLMTASKAAATRMRKDLENMPALTLARFRRCRPEEEGGLERIAWEEQAGLAVIPAAVSPAAGFCLAELANQISLPVFLIRRSPAERNEGETEIRSPVSASPD